MNENNEEKDLHSFACNDAGSAYKQLCDELPQIILITHYNGKLIYANRKAHKTLDPESTGLQNMVDSLELKKDGIYPAEFLPDSELPLTFKIESSKIKWEGKDALLHLFHDRTEQLKTKKLLQQNTHELKERNKELNALYEVSKLTSDINLDIEDLAKRLLKIIPDSWQFPEIAQARIQINDSEYISENYRQNIHSQSADIYVFDKKEGFIEVGYIQDISGIVDKPFLEEERALIDNIAFRTGKFIEKKRTETDMKFQSLLLNSVGEAIISTDMNGQIRFWNKGAEKIFGWKKEEVTGRNILEVNVTPQMTSTAQNVMKALQQGNNWSGKFIVRRKNGEEFPVIVTNSPLRDESGTLSGIIGISRDVSDIVRTENALKESFEKLNNVAENMPGTIFQFKRSKEGKYSLPFVSGRSQELFDLSPEEAMNNFDLVYQAIHPDDRLAFKQNIEKSYRNLTAYKAQHRTLHKDGSIRWFEANSLPKKLPNDDVLWTGVVLDMTAYKKTENLLNESEQRFNDISENLPGLVYQFELTPDGIFKVPYISKSAEKMFKQSQSRLMDATELFKNVHPEDLDDLMQSIYKSAESLSIWNREARVVIEGEGIKWIQGRAVPRRKTNGSILWNGVLIDITEKKYAELALQKNEEKLREAQQMAEMGNFELILPERKIKWSVEIAHLLEIPVSNELVELTEFKDLIESKDKWKVPHYVDQISTTGESTSFDLKVRTGESKVLYLHITGKPQKDESGKVVAIIGTAMNITQRKTYENELRKAKEKAEESDRLKSVFLQTMSHELRTPLNAVIGFSDLILEEGIEPEQYGEFVRLINNSGKHLLEIIEDIFEISALETGQSPPKFEKFSLRQFFNELDLILQQEKKKRQKAHLPTRFIPLGSSEKDMIITDRGKLRRLLTNLLVNALKFTHEGSVEYGYKIYRDRILFYVKDTGIGIEASKQKEVFERFRQGEESPTREYEGVGLGLSICKVIAELLKGEIWVESETGKGSTFYFLVPVDIPTTIAEEQKKELLEKPEKKGIFTGKQILIVEDEKSNMHLLELMLKHQGANIFKAYNGSEAIAVYESEKEIDLILMDIKMPVMNGFEATRKIRETNSGLPIIALTAYAQEGDRQKAYEAGCSDYISKPLRKDMLINKMKFHLFN